MAERARTACYERRMMYLERTIRRLSVPDRYDGLSVERKLVVPKAMW